MPTPTPPIALPPTANLESCSWRRVSGHRRPRVSSTPKSLAPHELRWPYYLGHIYKKDGKITESAAAFERAVKADGTFVPALVWLGNAYLDQSRPEAAQPVFGKALSLAPNTVSALFGQGRAAMARRDYMAAVTSFEKTLALDPSASVAHYPLALAYRALGDEQRAQAHLRFQETSGELRPPDPLDVPITVETAVGYEVRGSQALASGQWSDAREAFSKAVALAPADPALRHKYGTALAMSGDQAAARREFETIARRWPEFAKGHYSLGLIRISQGDRRGAIDAFRAAIRAAPTFLEARVQLAHALRRSGQPGAALTEYAHVLDIDPRVGDARFGSAMALATLERFVEARDQLNEAMPIHPDEPAYGLALARVLAAAPDERARDGARAVGLTDAIPAAQRTVEWAIVRALALAEAGRFEDAARMQRAAIASLEKNGSPALARNQSERLRQYESGRPSRVPWQQDESMELPDSGIAPKVAGQ